MQLTTAKLRRWNLGVGLFQLLTSAIIFGITDYDLTAPWYTFFILERGPDEPGFYIPGPTRIADVPIGVLSGVFLLLSALDHLFVTLPGVNAFYNKELYRNRNIFRWLEYSLSASIMRVQIATLSGVVSIHTLFAIFGLTAVTMLFGWLHESLNGHRLAGRHFQQKGRQDALTEQELGSGGADGHDGARGDEGRSTDWTPFIMGFVPHLFAWSIIACHFFQSVSSGDPPGFVWAIIFILFGLDLCFALVQLLQFQGCKGFRGFAQAEFAYIILSLTAKQLLAWIEFGGAQSLKPE